MWLALGEPPDCGVKKASTEGAWPKAAGILFRALASALIAARPPLRVAASGQPMVCAMTRPVIGLCTALEHARWSVWDQEAMLLPRSYLEAVRRGGGFAVMLAPDPALAEDPGEGLELVDGLVLAGGADIDPGSYGAASHEKTAGTVPERDAY